MIYMVKMKKKLMTNVWEKRKKNCGGVCQAIKKPAPKIY